MKNWQELRKNYPITSKGVYLKSASISAAHIETANEMKKWVELNGFNAAIDESIYSEINLKALDTAANLISATNQDVALTQSTSFNFNILAMMLKEHNEKNKIQKKEILALEDEFPSGILPFYHHGFSPNLIASKNGDISTSDFISHINEDTAAVVSSVVQFSSGLKLDIQEISRTCEKLGVPLFLNATQSLGVIPLDVTKINAQAITASCHKWLGAEMGLSLLYINPEWKKGKRFPLVGWGSVKDPFSMKNTPPEIREDVAVLQLATMPFVNLAGFIKSCEIAQNIGIQNIEKRIQELSKLLRSKIAPLNLNIFGPKEASSQTGIITLTVSDSNDLVTYLEQARIYVNERRGKVRISIHHYNNEEDIERLTLALFEYFKD